MTRATIKTGDLINCANTFHMGRVAEWRREQRGVATSRPRTVMNTTPRSGFYYIQPGGSVLIKFDPKWRDVSVHVHGGQATIMDKEGNAYRFGPVQGTRTEEYLQFEGNAPRQIEIHAGTKPVKIGLCFLVYYDPSRQAYGARPSTFHARQANIAKAQATAIRNEGLSNTAWMIHRPE